MVVVESSLVVVQSFICVFFSVVCTVCNQQAAWSSGMILGLRPRGPGFNSLSGPSLSAPSDCSTPRHSADSVPSTHHDETRIGGADPDYAVNPFNGEAHGAVKQACVRWAHFGG